MRHDDPFAGGIVSRLRRADRELAAAIVDAQCRDWLADRPDRVGFARLGHARREVRTALGRHRAGRSPAGLPAALTARWRARHATGPAPIDDPYLYAGLRRRIEACAVAARGDTAYRRRSAAADLEYALDWLAAAQELPRP